MSNEKDFVIEKGVLKKYTGPGGDVVIPDGVTRIGKEAFKECENLTGIVIPDSVTSIGREAFYYCSNLIIHAPAGSYAETYANKYHIPFVAE